MNRSTEMNELRALLLAQGSLLHALVRTLGEDKLAQLKSAHMEEVEATTTRIACTSDSDALLDAFRKALEQQAAMLYWHDA